MWDNINIPLGVTDSLEDLYAALIIGGIDKRIDVELYNRKYSIHKNCLQRFKGFFPFNVFYNNYAIFYEVFMTIQLKEFSVEQLDTVIESNKDLILDSPYIARNKYTETQSGNLINDDDFLKVVGTNLKEMLMQLSYREVSEEKFVSSCNVYITWFKETMGEYTALSMAAIMNKGYEHKKPNKRSRTYKGLKDMRKFYTEQMEIIDSLSEEKHAKSSVIDMEWFQQEVQKEGKEDDKLMFKVGLREIDSACRPLRRGEMLGIVGPPKGGKTRFTNFIVAVALQHGYNVCVWPLEGTKEEWEAMQVACLMAFESRAKTSKTDEMVMMSSSDILTHAYTKSKEMTKQVLAAKMLLASNTKLGRLSFIQNTAYVEDMFDVLQSHYDNVNQFDVLVVDQLINVMSSTGKGKVERTSEAYVKMKDFLANKLRIPALGVMPSQLKQEVIDNLRRNPDETIDVTGGAETAETVRTPDEIWGLFSSKEERANNIMKIYSVASRQNENFPDFQAKCFLKCCYFLSQEDA